uniref:DUF4220 domain-containing protein n=1 Tax=Leersia perrieri TaxID=77586 RepID=A0A0D9XGT7_9ORYZ
MIDVWSAVRWWDEWQLRILVLGSLSVQWFLLVAGPMRKHTIPQWFRWCIWLAYISSDALAIYALATLFNRHAKASGGGCSDYSSNGGKEAGILEILWAPVLLIHLGGRELTAYNIEDNELWLRHTVTLVSQVAVAVYAFSKSWPASADSRLRASAILLFIIGVLSFCEKPWAFNRARVNRLAEAASSLIRTKSRSVRWWSLKLCFTELELEEDEWWTSLIRWWRSEHSAAGKELPIKKRVHMLLSDMSLLAANYELKKMPITALTRWVGDESFSLAWLRKAFALIYTRQNVVWTPAYLIYHMMMLPALHAAAIVLFAQSHKRGRYNATDVKTTYVLLCFTAALDVTSHFLSDLLHWLMVVVAGVPSLCEWISQCNLMGEVLRIRRQPVTGCLIWCARKMGCYEGFFLCKRDNLYDKVAGYLVLEVIDKEYQGMIKGNDLGTYRNLGSKWWPPTLSLGSSYTPTTRNEVDEDLAQSSTMIQRTLQRESFDKSVLLWHIATDLCFCKDPPPAPINSSEVITEAISNYMAHLLNFRPDMLMTGTRQRLFTEAMDEVEQILQGGKAGRVRHVRPGIIDDQDLANTILKGGMLRIHSCHGHRPSCRSKDCPPQYPLIHDACRLAQGLLAQGDNRWELMYTVWMSMLFYSATMCRGYLHAKSLGQGGEFLTFVWILLSIKGAMTLPDKLQMPDQAILPQEDEEEETKDASD